MLGAAILRINANTRLQVAAAQLQQREFSTSSSEAEVYALTNKV